MTTKYYNNPNYAVNKSKPQTKASARITFPVSLGDSLKGNRVLKTFVI